MRKIVLAVAVAILWVAGARAQQTTAAPQTVPQTARQALIEMFFSKTPGTLAKHLPAATREALEKAGTLSILQQYSLLVGQVETQGLNVNTFETGPCC